MQTKLVGSPIRGATGGLLAITLCSIMFLSGLSQALAWSNTPLYKLKVVTKVTPAWTASSCYDIIVVNEGNAFVADNSLSAATASVQKIHGASATPIGRGLFQGQASCHQFDFSQEGPTGTLVVGDRLWAGDGNSTVRVFSLSGTLLATISTGTPADKRADEFDYIPTTNQVVVANPDASPHPFLTFIDASTHAVVSHQTFPHATALEQPRYHNGFLYLSVPGTTENPGGEIDKINPTTHAIVRVYPTGNCGPSGLAIIGRYAAAGCANGASEIVNLSNGQVTTLAVGKGADMVGWDNEWGRFFFADYASAMTIVTDIHGTILTAIPTDALAHSVAVDQDSHRVFIPEGSLGGVAQYVPTEEGV
jgi:hypothetical protein